MDLGHFGRQVFGVAGVVGVVCGFAWFGYASFFGASIFVVRASLFGIDERALVGIVPISAGQARRIFGLDDRGECLALLATKHRVCVRIWHYGGAFVAEGQSKQTFPCPCLQCRRIVAFFGLGVGCIGAKNAYRICRNIRDTR